MIPVCECTNSANDQRSPSGSRSHCEPIPLKRNLTVTKDNRKRQRICEWTDRKVLDGAAKSAAVPNQNDHDRYSDVGCLQFPELVAILSFEYIRKVSDLGLEEPMSFEYPTRLSGSKFVVICLATKDNFDAIKVHQR